VACRVQKENHYYSLQSNQCILIKIFRLFWVEGVHWYKLLNMVGFAGSKPVSIWFRTKVVVSVLRDWLCPGNSQHCSTNQFAGFNPVPITMVFSWSSVQLSSQQFTLDLNMHMLLLLWRGVHYF